MTGHARERARPQPAAETVHFWEGRGRSGRIAPAALQLLWQDLLATVAVLPLSRLARGQRDPRQRQGADPQLFCARGATKSPTGSSRISATRRTFWLEITGAAVKRRTNPGVFRDCHRYRLYPRGRIRPDHGRAGSSDDRRRQFLGRSPVGADHGTDGRAWRTGHGGEETRRLRPADDRLRDQGMHALIIPPMLSG